MKTLITNRNFLRFAKQVAYPSEPTEHVEAAMQRLKPYIEPYIVSVKGLRPQFRSRNSCITIPFDSAMDAAFYDNTIQRYYENCKKIGRTPGEGTHFQLLAEFTKLRVAADILKSPFMARTCAEDVKKGFTPIVASVFKPAIARTVHLLISQHGFKRDDISLIWGGNDMLKGGKSKDYTDEDIRKVTMDVATGKLKEKEARKIFKQIYQHLIMKENGLLNLDPSLRLGNQSMQERQREIDRLQCGRTKIGIFSIKAGGVGLSLQHTDKWTKEKVRRKDNGWAFEEDIPLIPTKPRRLYGTPVYSAIEIVQMLGRPHRIDSLSETIQQIVFFKDTIEEHVAHLVGKKLKSMKVITKQNDEWATCIYESAAKGQGIGSIIADFEDLVGKEKDVAPNDEDDGILDDGILEEVEDD